MTVGPPSPSGSGGWTYRRVRVNLTSQEAEIEEILPDEIQHWCGGRGLNAAVMRNEMPEGISPFNPDVPLCLASGPLAGSGAPCAGALYLASLAPGPMPPNYGQITLRGSLGAQLKWAGFDQIIIRGEAHHPVFIEIADDGIRIRDAQDFWGLNPVEASVAMQEAVSAPEAGVLAIGMAAEKRVVLSSLLSDFSWPADGLGFGALFGAKHLKGIVIHGNRAVLPWNPDAFREIAHRLRFAVEKDGGMGLIAGTGPILPLLDREGRPARAAFRNFRKRQPVSSSWKLVEDRADPFLACTGCPTACNRFHLRRGRGVRSLRFGGLTTEALLALGPRVGISEWDRVMDLVGTAILSGLDPGAVGAKAAWLAECRADGIVTAREAGGPIRFGDRAVIADFIRAIASREGAGRFLGDGTLRAASRFGPEAEARLLRWSGVDWPCADPRLTPATAMTFAAAPLDPDPFLHFNPIDMANLARHSLEDMDDPVEVLRRRFERRALADSLGVCALPFAVLPVWTPDDLFSLFRALTGSDPEGFSGIGKRVLALEDMLRRQRKLPASASIPSRFMTPQPGWDGVDLEVWNRMAKEMLDGKGKP